MRRTLLATTATLILGLGFGAYPVQAGTEAKPNISDPAGDGNFINGQDIQIGREQGPDTRPLNVDGADITAIWFETGFDSLREIDGNGKVTAVRRIPSSLKINIKTTGPASPAPGGFSTSFRVPAVIAGCPISFEGWVDGEASPGPLDLDQGAYIYKWTAAACPGGSGYFEGGGFSISFSGNVTTLTYRFDAAAFAYPAQGFLGDGIQIKPRPPSTSVNGNKWNPAAQTGTGSSTSGQFIDETTRYSSFIVGWDVPDDVDCIAMPDHAECAQ
jgi:hypothetical protein